MTSHKEIGTLKAAMEEHVIMSFTDPQGNITEVNAKFCAISGYSRAELLGSSHRITNSGHHPKEFFQDLWGAITRGVVWKGEIRNRAKDGSLYWVETTIVPLLNEDGKPGQHMALHTDITARKIAKEELRLFRNLVEQSSDTFEVIDPETGRFLDVNEKGPTELGFSREEYLSLRVMDIDPTITESNWPLLREKIRAEGIVAGEGVHRRKDGSHFPVEFNAKWVRLERDYIVTSVRDISKRKQAERATLRLAAIVTSSDDAIIGKNLAGVVTDWNRGAEHIFGFSSAEMVGTSITRLIPPERLADEGYILAKIRAGESVEHFETLRQTKDGRLINVSVTASPIRDATGTIIGASKVARDITGRKRAEEALRLSEERLRIVTDNARVGLVMINRELRYTFANTTYAEIYGLPSPDILGLRVSEVLPADLYEEQIRPRLESGFAGERVAYELHKPTPQGFQHFAVKYEPARVDGDFSLVVVITDITERKRTEDALRSSEERLRVVTDNARIGLVMVNPDRRYIFANTTYAEILGLPSPDILGQRVADILPALYEDQIHPRLDRAFAGERVDYELCRAAPEGNRHYTVRYEPTTVAGQVSFVVVVIIDITERKKVEEERRASEERYRRLFDYAPDGIVVVDPKGYYLDANASLCRMLGYTREEFIRLHASDVVAPMETHHIESALSEIKSRPDYQREWQFRRRNGSIFAVDTIATAMPDGNLLAIIRDITERKQADDEIQSQLRELQRWHEAMLGREERILELKSEVNELLARHSLAARYSITPKS